MMKSTNIENIRENAIIFLHLDIVDTPIPFIASHPFTDSWYRSTKDVEGEFLLLDLHEESNLRKWQSGIEKIINEADIVKIFSLLSKPYILVVLKHCYKDISPEDLGTIINLFWSKIEQISLDVNVTGREMVKLFKNADKNTLMSEEELAVYNSLPETVTIYRGVTSYNKKKTKAMSWTLNEETAQWFANRFDTGTGEVWSLSVPKERILCYFNNRNEKEVIVNLFGFTSEMTVKKQ